MDILVLGGTLFSGVHLVNNLINMGHNVTVATRGTKKDCFGDNVKRITLDRTDAKSLEAKLKGKQYDVVYDNIAFCSNDVKNLLNLIDTKRYIFISSASVYSNLHIGITEDEFKPLEHKLVWCNYGEFGFDYGECKRQAEAAVFQEYSNIPAVAVRFPVITGTDDYTKRLFFYVEHVAKEIPMHVDNMGTCLDFVFSDDAGRFMAFLADKKFNGPINAACKGTVSIKEIIEYAEKATGKKAVLSSNAEKAPFNTSPSFSPNVNKAESIGFEFEDIKDRIYSLIDDLAILADD